MDKGHQLRPHCRMQLSVLRMGPILLQFDFPWDGIAPTALLPCRYALTLKPWLLYLVSGRSLDQRQSKRGSYSRLVVVADAEDGHIDNGGNGHESYKESAAVL